jgi:hypothetical protein
MRHAIRLATHDCGEKILDRWFLGRAMDRIKRELWATYRGGLGQEAAFA